MQPEVTGAVVVDTVQPAGRLALVGNVLDGGRFELHAKRQFERLDATLEVEVRAGPAAISQLDFSEEVEFHPLQVFGRMAVLDEGNLRFCDSVAALPIGVPW